MKRLIIVLGVMGCLAIGTPLAFIFLMYDGDGFDSIPTELYTDEYNTEKMAMGELALSIEELEDGTEDDFIYNLSDDVLNVAIFQAAKDATENDAYAPDSTCKDNPGDNPDVCTLQHVEISDGYNLDIVGAWVEFQKDEVVPKTYIEMETPFFTYKTTIAVHFEITDKNDEYTFQFNKVKIGHLPVPRFLFTSLINAGLSASDTTEDELLEDMDGQGEKYTVSLTDMKASITHTQLVEAVSSALKDSDSDEVTAIMAEEILTIIYDNDSFTFDIRNGSVDCTIGISKFRNTDETEIPAYLVEMKDEDGKYDPESFDAEAHLETMFTQSMLTNALNTTTENTLYIYDEDINKMLFDGMNESGSTLKEFEYENTAGETVKSSFGVDAMWVEFNEDSLIINAMFNIASVKSKLVITATEVPDSTNPNEIKYILSDITFGKDADEADGDYINITDMEAYNALLTSVGDLKFMKFLDDEIVISTEQLTEVLSGGTNEDVIVVNGVSVVDGSINLTYTFTEGSEFDAQYTAYITEITAALESGDFSTVLADDPEMLAAVTSVQDALVAGEEVTDEETQAMCDSYEDMDEETQQAFLEEMEASMDPDTIADYEGTFE